MATLTLEKTYLGNTASGPQTVTLQIKLWNDPESSYVTFATATVDEEGDITDSPLPATTVTAGELYYVRSFNNCSSPIEYFVQAVPVPSI